MYVNYLLQNWKGRLLCGKSVVIFKNKSFWLKVMRFVTGGLKSSIEACL